MAIYFNISMDDSFRVNIQDRLTHLSEYVLDVLPRETPLEDAVL